MPRNSYKSRPKPETNITELLAAIKEIAIENKSIRTVSKLYNICRMKLSRCIEKMTVANLGIETESDDKLVDFLTKQSSKTGGKTVSCFISLRLFNILQLIFFFLDFHRRTRA